MNLSIRKYNRFWALYMGEELIAVIVYKKGAAAVRDLIESLRK